MNNIVLYFKKYIRCHDQKVFLEKNGTKAIE